MLTIRLPYPPSINNYWRHSGHRHYISTAGKAFRDNVYATVLAERRTTEPMTERLGVSIELTMPDKRKRDIDNVCKALLDALQYAGVYKDDCQIDDLRVQRLGVCAPGAADVIIQEIE